MLFEGGTFCDCKASDAEDIEWGVGEGMPPIRHRDDDPIGLEW